MSEVSFNVGRVSGVDPGYISASGYAARVKSQMDQVENYVAQILQNIENATPQVIYNALVPTKVLAEYYTPVKTGKLRASSYLEITDRGERPRVELGFAKNGDPPYAVYVHEMSQNFHAPPTRAKFLQAAVLEDIDNIRQRIIQGLSM